MAETCAKHPERASAGACKRCGGSCCSLCMLDVDGNIFCSLLCFTEHTLETKRRTLRDPNPPAAKAAPAPEPPPPPSTSDPDVIVPAGDAFDEVWSRLEKPEDQPKPAAASADLDPLAGIGLDATPGSLPR